ncbi:melatonin receptor type 1B-like isoform X1 [Convolutriloba macropyga]|uniref:melatonin receptor type 1B-like isoform X1 n=2 Tax=Convolutriloba macropyga TaxID=536237 RepID=UPI003F521741
MNDLGDMWDVAYLLWSVQWLLFGVPGNLMIIFSIIIFKELKTIPMAQTFNLAFSDLIVGATNVTTTWLILTYNSQLLMDYNYLCQLSGYICNMGCRCSIISICCISFNRYIKICHDPVYTKVYNKFTLPLHLLLPWTLGPVMMLPALLKGKRAFVYDTRMLLCPTWYFSQADYAAIQWYETISLLPPTFAVMAFTSYKIFAKVHESGKNFSNPNKTFTERDVQLMRVLLMMFGAFLIANFPWFILVTFDFKDRVYHGVYYVTVWLVHTATTLNPIIYAAKYPQFQKCFKMMISGMCCCQIFDTR